MSALLKAEIHKLITKCFEDNNNFKDHSDAEISIAINHLVEDIMPYVE